MEQSFRANEELHLEIIFTGLCSHNIHLHEENHWAKKKCQRNEGLDPIHERELFSKRLCILRINFGILSKTLIELSY